MKDRHKDFSLDAYNHFKYYYNTKGVIEFTDEQAIIFTNIYDIDVMHDSIINKIDRTVDSNIKEQEYSKNNLSIGINANELSILAPERGYISDNQKEMLITFVDELIRVQNEDPSKVFSILYIGTDMYFETDSLDDLLIYAIILDTCNESLQHDERIIGWTKDEFINIPSQREKVLSKIKKGD